MPEKLLPTAGLEVIADAADRQREGIRDEIPPALRSLVKNADPAYRYRSATVHVSRPGRIDEWKAKGYEIVPADAREEWEFGGRRDKEKGGQYRGDQVLMRTPRAVYERRIERIRRKGQRMAGEIHEQALENINRIAREGTEGKGKLAKPHENVAFGNLPKE